MSSSTRQLAAIMFTDMVGYTALMQENEQLALEKQRRNKANFEDSLAKYQGTLLQLYGDGTLSINASAVNAVLSAIEMQTKGRQENIDLRIGIHIGEILKDENGIYGDSVNVASRIESLAVPGSIFISEKLYDDIKNHENIHAKTLGYFELKNVKQPVQVFAIANQGVVVPIRDEVKGKLKETPNSIAVLPFINLSSDPENEFFCDGITEELLNVISKIGGLQVTSRTSSFALKGSKDDIKEIAAKLNVKKVLEGSVRKAGNKVRITAQLINAADGYHLWSETYDRSIEDIFAVQDEISRSIANKLRVNLSTVEHESQLVTTATENLEAYAKYLEGIHYWNKQSMQDIFKALECFESAVAMEPQFAAPYSNIGFGYWLLGFTSVIDNQVAERKVRQAAENAMKYDPSNPFSILTDGIVKMMYDWNWHEAYNIMQRVIAINPNIPFIYIILAYYHCVMLDFGKATNAVKAGLAFDPLGGYTNATLAQMYLFEGKYDETIAICDKTLALEPGSMYTLHMKAMALGLKGNWELTIEIISEILSLGKEIPILMVTLGIAHAAMGNMDKARQILQRMKEIEQERPGNHLDYELSMVYLHTGDMENFYSHYEKSIKDKSTISVFRYGTPFMKNIRNDERLIAIRKSIGLPY